MFRLATFLVFFNYENESRLKGGDMLSQFFIGLAKSFVDDRPLKFLRLGNRLRFRGSVLASIVTDHFFCSGRACAS